MHIAVPDTGLPRIGWDSPFLVECQLPTCGPAGFACCCRVTRAALHTRRPGRRPLPVRALLAEVAASRAAVTGAVPFSPRTVPVGRRGVKAKPLRGRFASLDTAPADQRRRSSEKDAAEWSPADVRAPLASQGRRELLSIRTSSQTRADQGPRCLQRWLDFDRPTQGPRATHRRAKS